MKQRPKFKTSEVIILVLLTFSVSFILGLLLGKKNIYVSDKKDTDSNLEGFIQNYNYIINNYYEDVDEEVLINGAIKGMVESLGDIHSMYFDSSQTTNFNVSLNGEYEGLGIEYYSDPETKLIVINGVIKNSPASKAGLKVNDIILGVDDKELYSVETSELSNYIFNSNKKDFVLKVKRGDSTFEVNITKAEINLESVTSEIYEKDGRKIGYIYISIFANNTDLQFNEHLEKLEQQNIDSLIIDVRQNTGGHLLSVENILKSFLTTKQVAYMMDSKGKISKTYGNADTNKKYDIVLLGDGGSASAAEVLISSLKENLGAYFIGEKTYGKGTVQELVLLSNDSQYKITTKKWLTPKKNWINDTKGIEPDLKIELNEIYNKTGNSLDDNQLQAAINYLIEKK